jgi:hypothetical protein
VQVGFVEIVLWEELKKNLPKVLKISNDHKPTDKTKTFLTCPFQYDDPQKQATAKQQGQQ